jgi:hypothetical protein
MTRNVRKNQSEAVSSFATLQRLNENQSEPVRADGLLTSLNSGFQKLVSHTREGKFGEKASGPINPSGAKNDREFGGSCTSARMVLLSAELLRYDPQTMLVHVCSQKPSRGGGLQMIPLERGEAV